MKKVFYYFILVLAVGCREKYDLPVIAPVTGFLVVDGTINGGQGPTTITLTRSVKLVDTFIIKYLTRATVRVQGKDNSSQALTETSPGVYTSNQLNLNNAQEYRLYIKTPEGKEYYSGYCPIKKTPAIESISWERNDGLQLYANTRDPQNNTKYYRWEYEETWEFHSMFESSLKYNGNYDNPKAIYRDPLTRNTDPNIITCWQGQKTTSILIASNARLSVDTAHFHLVSIPPGSWKISVMYSILVKQYALSKDGYEYLSKMKKNTEQTGSIFDSQPSELRGNIHNAADINEIVIGFIDVSEILQKRIFIKNSDLPAWGYNSGCSVKDYDNQPDSIKKYGYPTPTIPFEIINDVITKFNGASSELCVDCTLRGTNVKPSFWP
jgi:hypothetical protein